jgi:hypothetical protein
MFRYECIAAHDRQDRGHLAARARGNNGRHLSKLEPRPGMQVMAERLGIKAEFFSTPTVLIASLPDADHEAQARGHRGPA